MKTFSLKQIPAELYKRSALWCLLSGAVYSLSFFRGYLFVFGFAGLFMFYLKLFGDGSGTPFVVKPFKKTLFFSIGFFIPLYSWFAVLYPFEAFNFTKAEGVLIVIFADVGLGMLHAAMLSLCFLLLKIFPKNIYLLPVGAGACMTLFEWIASLGPLSFPWGTTAVGQYMFLPLIQNASLFGSLFIAFAVNMFASSASLCARYRTRKLFIYSACSISIPLLIGTALLLIPSGQKNEIKTAALQGNVLSMEKWDSDRLESIIDRYERLAEEAAENGAELIVLPESAIPSKYTSSIGERFSAITEKYDCTLIISAITYEDGKKYNSVFALYPDGSVSDFYSKQHLVPFGEYLPCKKLLTEVLPFLADLNLSSSPFTAGADSAVITLGNGEKLGYLVCFDSIFAPLARKSVENGAELMLVSTNDSWYEDSPGVYQHMAHSVIRAVETGRWLVRAANTGVSCYISPKGVIYGKTEPLTEAIIYRTVYTDTTRTLYSYIGDSFIYLPFLYILISLILIIKKKVIKYGNHNSSR